MKTKHLIKFLNNAAHLDVDLEFIDILQMAVSNGALKTNEEEFIFDYVDDSKHNKLSKRTNSDHSRKLVSNHLKSSVRESFIKSIYESTSVYFQDILKAVVRKGSINDRLLGEHNKSFSCKEIIELGSYPKIQEAIGLSIFRQLENERSTKTLLTKMKNKLGLEIDDEIINEALPFFEIRHLLVHSEGKADRKFCQDFPQFNATADNSLRITYEIVSNAKSKIIKLVNSFDSEIIAKNLVPTNELQA